MLTGQGRAIGLRFYQHVVPGLAEHLDELRTRLGAAPTIEIMEMTERGVPRWRTAPELLIFARNREGAQRAPNLLFAPILVFEGQSLFLEEIIAVPEDEDERGEYPPSLPSTPSRRPPLLEMPAQSLACAANGAGGTGRTLPPASTRTAGCARRGLSSAIDQNVIVHAQRHLLRRSNCPLLCNFRQ